MAISPCLDKRIAALQTRAEERDRLQLNNFQREEQPVPVNVALDSDPDDDPSSSERASREEKIKHRATAIGMREDTRFWNTCSTGRRDN
ncbi:hypothetical protein Ciccas_007229 [Cichlidogyrus casuarinus]|uniref:Uncharacterized protein n=1 Tax=Cichlidogyrus casuarinus TaxID=1844966 RepID=A0ABD2Q4S8_9PLAT